MSNVLWGVLVKETVLKGMDEFLTLVAFNKLVCRIFSRSFVK
jgi:hypothetical protein